MGKADFGIVIDSPLAFAGNTLEGRVWADIRQEIRGTSLVVTFKGKEQTCVRYTRTHTSRNADGTTRTHTTTHYAHGSRNICYIPLPVDQLEMTRNGRVKPGRYVLPFQFELPNFLPSSMEYSYNGGYARIQYKIKAVLKGSGVLWSYSAEQYTSVKSVATANQMIPYEGPPSTIRVRSCCYDKGSMSLGAHMTTTALAKGQAATICFSCRNSSTVGVDCVFAELKQRIRWTAGGHSQNTSDVIHRVNFSTAGLEAATKEDAKRQRGVDSVRRETDIMLDELRGYVNSQPIMLPLTALCTYSGGLIQVSHEIKMWVLTPGCCVDNPELRIPILACDTITQQQAPPLPPPPEAPAIAQPVIQPSAPYEYPQQQHHPPPSAPVAAIPFSNSGYDHEPEIVYAQPIRVESIHAILGGAIASGDKEDEVEVPPIATAQVVQTPSLETLLNEMRDSVGDVDTVDRRVNDPTWKGVFAGMNPNDYATVVSKVQSSFDETQVAVLVAQSISNFSCLHAATAVRIASDWSRTNMVEKLLPYCKDLPQNYTTIKQVLTEWEQSVTERAFQQALGQKTF